jgi:hypothetical protein
MRNHSLPTGLARNWKNLLRRWTLFREHAGNRHEYCKKYLVDTTASTFVRKAKEGGPDWAYGARQDLIKALQEYQEPVEEAEEEEDEEVEEDDVSSDDEYRISSPY